MSRDTTKIKCPECAGTGVAIGGVCLRCYGNGRCYPDEKTGNPDESKAPVSKEQSSRTTACCRNGSPWCKKEGLCVSCERDSLRAENEKLKDELASINTPEIKDFMVAVEREAKHQRLKWGSEHDAGKADVDWLWLLGYLAGKAIHAPTPEKALHHIITSAAACLNWHSAKLGIYTAMRPGIEPPK
jgi:hypothetical protein